MHQLLLPGFPVGAIRVGESVSILKKDGRVTYFVGSDNYFSHAEGDHRAEHFAIAVLIANRHMRLCDTEATLGIPRRTIHNWLKQHNDKGADSFFILRRQRGAAVMQPELSSKCGELLAQGLRVSEVARSVGVGESTLRKAVKRGSVKAGVASERVSSKSEAEATTKSERSRQDAEAAAGMGTACTRADERIAVAIGLVEGASTRYESCKDVTMGGVLAGLPALCANGLLSGIRRYLSLPKGYYSVMHILITLGVMALARIRRPEGLRHVPPGELGKVVGLDRVPEVRTLREKIALLAEGGMPQAWMKDLSRMWMEADPTEAGYLYIDGHVRVYYGSEALLPRRYVTRERLCLRSTVDYWINDALGRPFFVVSKTVSDGLASTLINEIMPDLLEQVPGQPSEEALAADPVLQRFVVIFDREGSTYSLLSKLWEKRIGAITYRKAVKDLWPASEFKEADVPVPGGGTTPMMLAFRETVVSADTASMPVLEVRRLTKTGHQTAIITTARNLKHPVVAGRMFTRWCQENFFRYMMEHYDIDGLVQYGSEEIPGTVEVVNPAWRTLDQAVAEKRRHLRALYAEIGATALNNDEHSIQMSAERLYDIQHLEADMDELRKKRRATPRKVPIASLPEAQRPRQLAPLTRILTDTIKMIAYRAETALVELLKPHLANEDEARAMIRELFVSSADIIPNQQENTLTIRIHRMACPAHDNAISALLAELTQVSFTHPETGMRLIYMLT